MAHHPNHHRPGGARPSLYGDITDRIIAELEAGRLPWVQPWSSGGAAVGLPYNAASDRRYSGINILTLWHAVLARGFRGHGFLTFRQAAALGGSVRRGEQGTAIVYSSRAGGGTADTVRHGGESGSEPHAKKKAGFSFLKQFTVFSVDQCDGLPDEYYVPVPPIAEGLIVPEAEALIAATGADFRVGGVSAYYSPHQKKVDMAQEAEKLLEKTDWLPEPLRTPLVEVAEVAEDETAQPSGEAVEGPAAEEEHGDQGTDGAGLSSDGGDGAGREACGNAARDPDGGTGDRDDELPMGA